MSKFCVHCGKPLQEGEVCSCRSQAPQQPQVSQQQVPQQQVPQQQVPQQQVPVYPAAAPVAAAPVAPSGAEIYLKQLWSLITKIFRAPASMSKSFAASADSNTAIGLIVIHVLTFALFMLAFCGKISATINRTTHMYDFPLAKDFFLSLFLSLVVAFLFAGILLFFNKTVFKANTTYRHMLCVTGASGIASVPFVLAGIIILFMNMNVGICVASLGVILQLIYAVSALKGASQIDENKAAYVLFLSAVVLMIAVFILIKMFYTMYLPDALVNGFKEIESNFSSISNLLS